jgi:hypothetical protein
MSNPLIEYGYADENLAGLPGLASELIHLNLNVLLTSVTPATLAAKKCNHHNPYRLCDGQRRC